MNTLSWLLYAADVIPNVGILFGFMAGAVAVGCIAALITGGCIRSDSGMSYNRDKADEMRVEGRTLQKRAFKYLPLVAVLALISSVFPSTQTIYMIAASEMGETIVTNPEAQELFDGLKAKVKEYLAPAEAKP